MIKYVYVGLLLAASLLTCRAVALADGSDGELDSTKDPNVQWSFGTNIAACPAGDSVVTYRDARVLIDILYSNSFHLPKVGVPPESIWVVAWAQSGNIRPYDYSKPAGSDSAMVFADDSTNWANVGSLVPNGARCSSSGGT